MSADLLFQVVNAMVLPAWLCLLVAPAWRYTQTLAFGVTVPVLALAYASLMVKVMGGGAAFSLTDFTSLEGVQGLLGNPFSTVLGWTHYLAFDLFVGAWIVRDSRANGIWHLLVVIPLVLTFLAGPLGLLLYLVIRQARRRQFLAEPSPFAGVLRRTAEVEPDAP